MPGHGRAVPGTRRAAVLLTALAFCLALAPPALAAPGAVASGVFPGFLTEVSCPGTGDCWAVGQSTDGIAVTDHWNGTAWHVVNMPAPLGATFTYLPAVSCASASYCWAVGQYKMASGSLLPYAVHWNGSAWSESALPRSPESLPIDVSCVSTASCWAVGGGNGLPLFEHWNGHAWAVVSAPALTSRDIPERVTCVSDTDCWATGLSDTDGALTAHWDGTAWTPVHTPLTSSPGAVLLGVSCSGAAACMAVGGDSGTGHPVAARWNGSAWAVTPAGTKAAGLEGLACTAGLRCVAVGATTNPTRAFTEIWNGSRWQVAAAHSPAGAGLVGVSCPAAGGCWAVGSRPEVGHLNSLIEHWNGTTWSIVT